MTTIFHEYVSKNWGIIKYQDELQRLIKEYNKLTNSYLLVYASDINKGRTKGIDISLVQDDFYTIQDMLREVKHDKLDFYIETPGGSGEAAEEIAKFLRKKFKTIDFVIAGESKSAGTILVLSGDNIKMTETGSLGPIDAQVRVGRSVVSAHDYKEWVDEVRAGAQKTGRINPFDALMIAQISPGELKGIINSLEFAKDLVTEWLAKYKFKNWTVTETKKTPVTTQKREERAKEVAEILCNHTEWRTHGRSLKIEDLQEVLKIEKLEDAPDIAELVYRIKTIIRLMFESSTIYKIYFTEDFKLSKTYTVSSSANSGIKLPIKQQTKKQKQKQKQIDGIELDVKCPRCNTKDKVLGYFDTQPGEIKALKLKTNDNVSENEIFTCKSCSLDISLKPIKNKLEIQLNRKINFK